MAPMIVASAGTSWDLPMILIVISFCFPPPVLSSALEVDEFFVFSAFAPAIINTFILFPHQNPQPHCDQGQYIELGEDILSEVRLSAPTLRFFLTATNYKEVCEIDKRVVKQKC